MEVILTDVTHMSGTHVCIAGWDIAQQRLVRPLLPKQKSWTTNQIGQNKFQTGSIVNFVEANLQPTGHFPHLTEDVIITGRFTISGQLTHTQIHVRIVTSLTNNLDQYFMFNNPQQAKRHTPDGTQTPSLGGITVQGNHVRFYETSWDKKRKLRCEFSILYQPP